MKTTSTFFYAIATCLLVGASSAIRDSPIIHTKLGDVRGTRVNFYGQLVDVYLGVPFAEPPVGELRFRRPKPVKPWTDPIDATTLPPACVQFSSRPFPWYESRSYQSEDCLYMNIWVPSPISRLSSGKTSGKAVLYWLYGGGFSMGSNGMPVYDGRALASIGDVIVVTVNYRLGALGFLYSGTEDAPGNAGFYDMLLGLQWVNDHIESFGGNKNAITIIGESAGSIAVGLLMVSPLAKGLFKRAIMESASPAYLLAEDKNDNFKLSEVIARHVDCANDTATLSSAPSHVVKCLRGVSPISLSIAPSVRAPHSPRAFLVQYGDDILPENPRKVLISGNFTGTDLLIGNVLDEGSFQVVIGRPDLFGYYGERDFKFNKSYGESILNRLFSKLPDTEKITQHYLGGIDDNDSDGIRQQVYSACGDYTILCPTVYFAEQVAEKGEKVYYFLFAHQATTNPWAPWMGVAHFEDVKFVFGEPLIQPQNYEPDEVYLSEDIIKMWTTFAKKGVPEIKWPLYTKKDPVVKVLDTSLFDVLTFGPHPKSCDFLRKYFGF